MWFPTDRMTKGLARWLDLFVFSAFTHRKLKMSRRKPDRRKLQPYLHPRLLSDPESFYTKPDAIPPISESLSPVKRRRRYEVFDFHFPSAIASSHPELNTVYGRYFKTRIGEPAPTVIVLHGWLAFNYVWYTSICQKLARMGTSSLIIQLPYHMQRRLRTARYSGEWAISGDMAQSIEMIRQSVADTRSVINWLTAQSTAPIGLWGVSLGGWIGALLVAVESRLDFAVLMTPAVRPDDVMWFSKLCPPLREVIASAGFTYDEVAAILRVVTPTYFSPRLSPERLLLIQAEVDQAVRPHTIEELWRAWNHPRLRRYPHGHISVIISLRALRDTFAFIKEMATVTSGVLAPSRQWPTDESVSSGSSD